MSPSNDPFDIYQPFLSYSTQHVILNAAQRVMEDCFYKFASVHMPSLLWHPGWQCSVAVELTEWIRIFRKVISALPRKVQYCLQGIFHNLVDLRNTAVHRRLVSQDRAEQLLRSAMQMAQLLQNRPGIGRDWGMTKLHEFQKKLSEPHHRLEDGVSAPSQAPTGEVHSTLKDLVNAEDGEPLLDTFWPSFHTVVDLFMKAVQVSACTPEEFFFADDIEDGESVIIVHVSSYSKYYTWSPEELQLRQRSLFHGDEFGRTV